MSDVRTIVMVVDDERAVVDVIQTGLERQGYSVVSFLDPQEAYQYFKANKESVCVVISNCTMPKLTGWDLARKLLDLDPGVPIVMITGAHEADVPEDLHNRLHRILYKPFTRSDITESVKSAHDCRA